MDADLKSLEEKLSLLITLCQRLRGENSSLRQQLVQIQNDNQKLRDNMNMVSTRLEAVIDRLPEESV